MTNFETETNTIKNIIAHNCGVDKYTDTIKICSELPCSDCMFVDIKGVSCESSMLSYLYTTKSSDLETIQKNDVVRIKGECTVYSPNSTNIGIINVNDVGRVQCKLCIGEMYILGLNLGDNTDPYFYVFNKPQIGTDVTVERVTEAKQNAEVKYD